MIMHYSVNRVNYYSKYDTKYEWGMEEASGEWSIVLCLFTLTRGGGRVWFI